MAVIYNDEERRARLETELPEIVERLKAKGAIKIVLFGSLAQGDVGPASDLDLLVVMETEKSFSERLAYLYDGLSHGVAVDILPYTPREMAELQETRAFLQRAVSEGRVLYEA